MSLATRGFSTASPASPASAFTPRSAHPLPRALTSPTFLNTHFIFIPAVAFISILVPSILVSVKYEQLGARMTVFHAALDELAASVDMSTASKVGFTTSFIPTYTLLILFDCIRATFSPPSETTDSLTSLKPASMEFEASPTCCMQPG